MIQTPKRPCPVCGSLQSRLLFKQHFDRLSDVTFLDGYDVVVCSDCGLAFADGIPNQATLDAYYRDLSKYEYTHRNGRESPLDEARFRDIADYLATVLPLNTRILEIGCATGRLLALLRERGFIDVHGLDPSSECSRAAWELYRVPVSVGSIFSIPTDLKPVDVVIVIGVLEHIEDVRGALSHVRRALAPGGRVYSEVPDAAHLAGRPDGPYQEFSTEHIVFFSLASMTNLFRVSGFDLETGGELIRQQHENTTYPAAFGLFRTTDHPAPVERDKITEEGLKNYIVECARTESATRTLLAELAARGPVLVWGTGTHTQRLLAIGAFNGIDIAAFIDSNPKYHGKWLNGALIISPNSLEGRTEPILISTRGCQAEISEQIRFTLKAKNEIVLLYP